MGEVVNQNWPTRLDTPVKNVLDNAPRDLSEVVIVGFDAEGDFYFASSKANGADVLWALAMAQKKLLEMGDDDA